MQTTRTWTLADFRRKYSIFRQELLPWTIFYLLLSIIWGIAVYFLWSQLGSTPPRRGLVLILALGTCPLILGAIHTWRIQARHGLRCPFCRYGLGGGAGKLALLNGKCPGCGETIIEA